MSNMTLKGQLDTKQLIIFESEMKWRTKSGPLAFVLWASLGLLGAHHFYLGRWLAAIGQLLLTVAVVALYGMAAPALLLSGLTGWLGQEPGAIANVQMTGLLLVIASVAAIAMWLWWFISVFFIPSSIRRQAYKAERTLLDEMLKSAAQAARSEQAPAPAPAANAAPVMAAPVTPAPVAVTTEAQPESSAKEEPPAQAEKVAAAPQEPATADAPAEQDGKMPPGQT